MVTKVFQLLLLLSPIAIGSNINMELFDLIFFRMGIICLFAASLIDKQKRIIPEWINKITFALIGLCIINLFIHTFNPIILGVSMNLFLAIVGMYIVYQYWDDKQSIRKWVLWAGVMNLAFFICQELEFDPIWNKLPNSDCMGAFLGNKPRMMTYFALITPFLPIPFLVISLGLALYTHQLIILAPVVIMLFAKLKKPIYRFGILFIAFLAMIFFRDDIYHSLYWRFNVAYKPVLDLFFDQPLIGFGLGVRPIPELEAMGCDYLQFIAGVGIAGAVWFWYVGKSFYKKIKNNIESLALISLAVIMLVEYPLEIVRLWYLIMGIIVMFLIKNEVKECPHSRETGQQLA